jgi:hypothetical protein
VVEEGAGPRLFYPEPPRPQPLPVVIELRGSVIGRNRSTSKAFGQVVIDGHALGLQVATGSVIGERWPDDAEVAKRKRLRLEEELLILEI